MRRVCTLVLMLLASALLLAPVTTHPLAPRQSLCLPIVIAGHAAAPSPTPTDRGTPGPLPSPTPTMAPQDLHLSGVIYDAQGGPSMPIAGARVAALLCVPRAFSALADQAGRYALFVPASYANLCSQLTLEGSAPGYATFSQSYDVRDLLLHPQRDFPLQPAPGRGEGEETRRGRRRTEDTERRGM